MIRGFFYKFNRRFKNLKNVIFHVKLLSPTLNNAWFWQYVKGLKNKIHTAVRRNLEEILEVKTLLKMSTGFESRGPKVELRFCSF